ncbi:MAG: 16S rRNA (uracil1498-N3)-methyltransferase [Flavobacteriales bacterium]|jgi:16S rRNA (uracil1498-N3)-methyltransferase
MYAGHSQALHNLLSPNMNLFLIDQSQCQDNHTIILSERQTDHLNRVLKAEKGMSITIGMIDGELGRAEVLDCGSSTLAARLAQPTTWLAAPKTTPLTLILALPRPQMIKRILQTVATYGIERLVLIQTKRVEKSFWQSPAVSDEAIKEQLRLGLEQGKGTRFPEIQKFTRFREFTEDHAPALIAGRKNYVAHPGEYPLCPTGKSEQASTVAIGPEGGFNEFEFELLCKQGFEPIQLGTRILRVETAVNAVLARWL